MAAAAGRSLYGERGTGLVVAPGARMFWTMLSLVACLESEDLAAPPGEAAAEPIVYDWSAPEAVELGGGWTLDACDGDGGPVHCLYVGEIWRGTVEHLAFDAYGFESLRGEADREAGMDALVDAFDASMRADRAAGCADWTYESHPVRDVTVAGSHARAYGFSLYAPEWGETDRTAGWLAWIGDTVHILATEGLGDGACLSVEGAAPTPGELASLTTALDRVAAGSVFPE